MIWFLIAPIDMLVSLLAFPMAPLIVLCTSGVGISPWWAWPWLTHDNTIDGDGGHLERWAGHFGFDVDLKLGGMELHMRFRMKKPIWIRRIAWLWRNRGYNFSYHVCGAETNKPVRIVAGRQFWLDANPKGWCIATCGSAWMLFAWFPYSANRGLRVYLGWKLRGKIDNPYSNPRAMLVTHINPLKGKM